MMTRTKVFSKDYLMDELDLPYDNTIVDRIVNTTRWSIIHEIVFEDNGKFYMTTYSEGATECQRMKDLGNMMMKLNAQK